MGAGAAILQPSHQTKPHSQTRGRDNLHTKALQEARAAHQWTLDAVHVLEMNIKRLSQEANSTKCKHHHSCSQGRLQGRHVWSLNPHRPKRCVTFCEPEKGTSSDERPQREPKGHLTRGEVEEGNLGPPPTLRLELKHFLEPPTTSRGTREGKVSHQSHQ